MKLFVISICCMFTFFSALSKSDESEHLVSLNAIEMNIERMNDNLFRWIKFHPESDYPCLRLELLKPGSNALIKRENICSVYDDALKITHDFKKLSFLEIYNLKTQAQTFTFDLELSLLSQNVVTMNCSINIGNTDFSPVICEQIE